MDEVTFHREPPANLPTLVTAFSGWIDAREAATDAMRFLVRQLAAEPLAAIDLEDFADFTQVRPVVRLSAKGERTIRWPRSAFWLWQPPEAVQGCCCFGAWNPSGGGDYPPLLLAAAVACSASYPGGDLPPAPYPPPARHGQQHHPRQPFERGMARRSR